MSQQKQTQSVGKPRLRTIITPVASFMSRAFLKAGPTPPPEGGGPAQPGAGSQPAPFFQPLPQIERLKKKCSPCHGRRNFLKMCSLETSCVIIRAAGTGFLRVFVWSPRFFVWNFFAWARPDPYRGGSASSLFPAQRLDPPPRGGVVKKCPDSPSAPPNVIFGINIFLRKNVFQINCIFSSVVILYANFSSSRPSQSEIHTASFFCWKLQLDPPHSLLNKVSILCLFSRSSILAKRKEFP